MAALCREFEVGSAWLRAQFDAWQVPRRVRKLTAERGVTALTEPSAGAPSTQAKVLRISACDTNSSSASHMPKVDQHDVTTSALQPAKACGAPSTPKNALSVADQGRPGTPSTLLPHIEAQPRFQQTWPLKADASAPPMARIHLRTWLTVARWKGNVDQATRVASHLVENAVRHGTPLQPGNLVFLRVFGLFDSNDLAIEVEDALPHFPTFEEAANQSGEVRGKPTGLWWVAHYRGRLSWDVNKNGNGRIVGKTVQAIIPATWDGSE